MTRLPIAATLALAAATSLACEKTGAYGDMDSIIVATSPDLWAEVQDSIYAALEPRVFTVRQERTFQVTFQDPFNTDWRNLREFKQELLIGRSTDPWMAPALEQVKAAELSPPQVIQTYNVWARGQNVTMLLLTPDGGAEEVFSLLDELHELYDSQFRQFTRNRMFITGRDSALADTLIQEAGFSLIVPQVYFWDRQDSVFIFRNDNPDPSELIRQVAVTWRSPDTGDLTQEELLAWREHVAAAYYGIPQETNLQHVAEIRGTQSGRDVFQVQAVWENPPDYEWPAAGPFLTRTVACPEVARTYLLDAWLYAPGRSKYEYMIQLETILDSFECGVTED